MSPYLIGAIIGALIATYLMSRLWLWLAGKFSTGARRLAVAYVGAWVTCMVLGAMGYADGGPPEWFRALMNYTPALAFWLALDLLANRTRGLPGIGTSR